jgi:hypothetical protein
MVILSNTVVTKHELGRAWPWLHGVSSGADAEETEGECQEAKGVAAEHLQVTRRSLVQGLARLGCRRTVPPPLQHDLTRRSMRYE